jgi:hypothetical protein
MMESTVSFRVSPSGRKRFDGMENARVALSLWNGILAGDPKGNKNPFFRKK